MKTIGDAGISIAQIADCIDVKLPQHAPNIFLQGLAPLEKAKPTDISFCTRNNVSTLLKSRCGAVITTKEIAKKAPCFALCVTNPRLALAKVSTLFVENHTVSVGIDPQAIIASGAHIADNVRIDAGAIIEAGVVIASDVHIGSGSVIERGTHINQGTRIGKNVVIYANTHIGTHCIIHAGAVIGADGFGFEQDQHGKWHKIYHTGGVDIGNEVEIGANTTIDCGTFSTTCTTIGNGVKIDNLVQIGHNAIVGDHCVIVGGCMISGHVEIGEGCILGGKNGITPGVRVAPKTILTSGACINADTKEAEIYTGLIPAKPRRNWIQFLKKAGYFSK